MNYVSELRKEIGTKPLILTGAVVVILNNEDQVLLQQRSTGGWGLPGGLSELGESLEQTAIREVYEETGLTVNQLKLLNVFSGNDYYIKLKNGDEFYSTTAVYITRSFTGVMRSDGIETKDLKFFSFDDLPIDLLKVYRKYLEPFKREITSSYKAPVSCKGVILNQNRVLLLKNERNVWELPGGRMEPRELPEETVTREISEEIGLDCKVEKIVDAYNFEVIKDKHVFIVTYHCKVQDDFNIQLSDEHIEYGWFSKKDLEVLDLAKGYQNSILKVFSLV
ncbi:NUDIX domain-containing protein [Chengkuizengella sp. SCS-71B]|uniref:NUDIX domain-containing protein n=1 Tax=Chengkuizengella sp. SCS-71B TaxID=3115290 RepID=UPI0032C23F7A